MGTVMLQRLPPLSWLRAFEASARHLSFTSAAEELNLTQAAVSKQVKLLEHYLREPLFHRGPRSLVITKVGAAYLPKVRDAFDRLRQGTEEVFGRRRTEVLTVRAAAGFAVNWLGPRLSRFFDSHPGVEVRFVSSVWSDENEGERYDLDVRYGIGHWPGMRADRLTWEVIEPACSPRLLEGATALRTPADLAKHRLLHVMGYREGWATWLEAAGAGHINAGQGLQFDTSLLAFEFAAHGGGVALARSSMSAKEFDSGRLVRPFDLPVEIEEAFHLVSPDEGADHPHTEVFRSWLLAEAEAGRQSLRRP
jgi:LysR family transcriptional regulator, glycine cleavage system transcriptional activator